MFNNKQNRTVSHLNISTRLAVRPGQVDVWQIPLDRHADQLADMLRLLDSSERLKAGRFHQAKHQRRFVVRRWATRSILSRYLLVDLGQIIFCHNKHGKPYVHTDTFEDTTTPSKTHLLHSLRFSLSHSHEMAVLAVVFDGEVGVDIEVKCKHNANERVAAQFFTSGEQNSLRGLGPLEYVDGFFNAWTRKEAFVKAIGKGLRVPLDAFEVSLHPGRPADLIWASLSVSGGQSWFLNELRVSSGYTAAVCTSTEALDIRQFQFSDQPKPDHNFKLMRSDIHEVIKPQNTDYDQEHANCHTMGNG